ncbi:MAG: hypothetical protein F4X25_06990 [Chloroflexi bacterium]|nr:hypothetical protein [Chloroflexota bacterium]
MNALSGALLQRVLFSAVATLLGVAAALLQLGATPLWLDQPLAAPVLPLIVIAGWGAARGLGEAVPAAILAASVLGVASEERAGWFLLAMLPTAALLLPAAALRSWERLLLAPLAAGLGVLAFQAMMRFSSGLGALSAEQQSALIEGATWTAVPALALTVILAAGGWTLQWRPTVDPDEHRRLFE